MTPVLIGMPGGWEWLIILLIAVLLFGGSRLAGLGKSSGRAIREFKEETRGLKADKADQSGATRVAEISEMSSDQAVAGEARRAEDEGTVADSNRPDDLR